MTATHHGGQGDQGGGRGGGADGGGGGDGRSTPWSVLRAPAVGSRASASSRWRGALPRVGATASRASGPGPDGRFLQHGRMMHGRKSLAKREFLKTKLRMSIELSRRQRQPQFPRKDPVCPESHRQHANRGCLGRQMTSIHGPRNKARRAPCERPLWRSPNPLDVACCVGSSGADLGVGGTGPSKGRPHRCHLSHSSIDTQATQPHAVIPAARRSPQR